MLQPEADDDHATENDHGDWFGFHFPVQQDEERNQEAKDEHSQSKWLPGKEHDPLNYIDRFFGNIAVPDDQQLHIEEIGPKQTEGEQELAEVMKMTRGQA